MAAVDDGDDHDARQVVDHREGEQVGADPVGKPSADEGERAERERRVGGHRHAPAARRRVPGVEGEIDGDGPDHAPDPGQQGQRQPAPLAQFAHVELAPGLHGDHEEEERHQPGVHPFLQVPGQAGAAEVKRKIGRPEGAVGPWVYVGPGQGGYRRGQQNRGAAGLGPQELAQRGQVPGPRRHPGQQRRRRVRGRHSQDCLLRGLAARIGGPDWRPGRTRWPGKTSLRNGLNFATKGKDTGERPDDHGPPRLSDRDGGRPRASGGNG